MTPEERLIRYAKINTVSDPESPTVPSSACQLDLLKVLKEEMEQLGIQEVREDQGYLYGRIPSNLDYEVPTVGFIAHMDTAPDFCGEGVNPRIIPQYDGKDIALNDKITLKVSDFPNMARYTGQDLIVTDGNTLLGADDKAGIADILTMAETLLTHPEIKHGEIRIGFTPDEEIGRGADLFDVANFHADFAYTVDGGEMEAISDETFNAASAKGTVQGFSIHPGSAKHKMINSLNVAMEFHAMLPVFNRPEYTEGIEGFNHLNNMEGNVEQTVMEYIIRNHDSEQFQAQMATMKAAETYMNQKYGQPLVQVEIKESYRNMKEILKDQEWIVDLAKQAITEAGLQPWVEKVRGGTDGARLTFMGLPCPNLGTGGANCHGRYEVCSVQEMHKVVEILLNIVKATTNLKK